MKKYIVNTLLLSFIIINISCSVYNKTSEKERTYLMNLDRCQGGFSAKSSILPTIKQRAVDFINNYSSMELKIVSDTLISTEGTDGISVIKKNDKYQIGYKVKIKPKNDGLFAISVKCYTNVIYKNKKEKNDYENIFQSNRLIFLNYLATEEIMPKFINNPKNYDKYGPFEKGDIDLK